VVLLVEIVPLNAKYYKNNKHKIMFTVQLKKSLKNIAKASDKLLALQLLYLVLLIKMIVNRQAPLGQQIELKNK
jgi:hypothetical protein